MKKTLLIGSAVILFLSQPANAEFVTEDDIDDMTRINFNYMANVTAVPGPVQIGTQTGFDVTVETSSGVSLMHINAAYFGLGGNGSWNAPETYLALAAEGELLIKFNSGDVSQVGAFMNYSSTNSSLIITAYDSNMTVLESHDVAALANISTPGGENEGAFRGIERPQADIAVFGIYGNYPVVDHLTFGAFVPQSR